ncbi:MAG: 16S rRNA (guanine(966)-N(2))-methyltransferase RsmD [Planctomycetes bacterium]|nr:16S rRNA (guanine(966)-N(2))-methyltransferase RsmD [Planctomycetota bacterium]
MRIITGKWRSRKLDAPRSSRTRPMPERVREAVFDILAARFELPGMLPPIHVADLFAGSGSMGFEAVSRGAEMCHFYERGPQATRTIKHNIEQLEAQDCCRVIRADAWTACLATPRPQVPYGLVFIDPPYRDARDASANGRVPKLLADLSRADWVDAKTIVVVHHEAAVQYNANGAMWWRIADHRTYGTAGITLMVSRTSSPWGSKDRELPPDDSTAV